MSFFLRLRGPVYQNTGSTARDHLALERTFLAWLRTGLGFIALGIAVERFSQLDLQSLIAELKEVKESPSLNTGTSYRKVPSTAVTDTKAKTAGHDEQFLVVSLLGIGSASIGYGIFRHFSTMKYLEKGLFRPAYYGAGALGSTVVGIAGASWGNMQARRMDSKI